MKKNDFILIGIVLLVAISGYIFYNINAETSTSVLVSVNGELYGEYSLEENQVVEINESNILLIQDGEAYMIEATCPDGLCLHQGAISKSGESIICLPNEVVVVGSGNSESEFDATTH
ncbi:MAG: NusG domain II-containing protein [Eubacteriales bacterium]